jgi:DNA primase
MLIFDPDPAGVKATLRGFELFAGSGMKVNVVSLPDGDDPDTFLKNKGYDAFAACLKGSAKFMDFVLAQVVKDGAAASIDEKVERGAEMLRFIAKLPSGIEQDHYLRKTAEALNVDEATLRQDMAKQRAAHTGPRERIGEKIVERKGHRPKAEEMLVHLMLRDENIARELAGQLTAQDFTDPLFQRAAKRIFDVLERGDSLDLRLLQVEGDEELNRLLTYYSVRELDWENEGKPSEKEETKNKSVLDCVALIKQHDPERQIKAIIQAIQKADEQGDIEEYRRLQAIQMELIRRPGRRIPGR